MTRSLALPNNHGLTGQRRGLSEVTKRRCKCCKDMFLPSAFTRRGRSTWVECNVCSEHRIQLKRKRKERLMASIENAQTLGIADCSEEVLLSTEVSDSSGGSFTQYAQPERPAIPDAQIEQVIRPEAHSLSGSAPNFDGSFERKTPTDTQELADTPFDLEYHLNQPPLIGAWTEEILESCLAAPESERAYDFPSALSQIAARFSGCDWRPINILKYTPLPTSTPVLHRHLISYALSVRLLIAAARWRPYRKSGDARLEFLRELHILVKLLHCDAIEPWPPLKAWLEDYASNNKLELHKLDLHNQYLVQNSVKQFGVMRVLAEGLTSIAQARLASARLALWETLLVVLPEAKTREIDFKIFPGRI